MASSVSIAIDPEEPFSGVAPFLAGVPTLRSAGETEGVDFGRFLCRFSVFPATPSSAAGEPTGLKKEKRVDDCSGAPLRFISLSLSLSSSPSAPRGCLRGRRPLRMRGI